MLTLCPSGDSVVESTAAVLPFPRVRHRNFVVKHADRMRTLPPATAEKYLVRQLDVQRETMIRRGILIALIEQELDALEKAIRVAMWCVSSVEPDGVAG